MMCIINIDAKNNEDLIKTRFSPERSLDTVVRAGSAAVLVGFTSLQRLPCALAPATTRIEGACW